jgi:hypothetical protein
MITPIRSAHASDVEQGSQPAAKKPKPQAQAPTTQKSGELSHDQVTLHSAGQADHDGDSK